MESKHCDAIVELHILLFCSQTPCHKLAHCVFGSHDQGDWVSRICLTSQIEEDEFVDECGWAGGGFVPGKLKDESCASGAESRNMIIDRFI
ncbi:hypothetical protein N7504_002171 [Penicillium tannophilum]|nr:hypothetical protein N7504_002171 [Penicillium tannophilum]